VARRPLLAGNWKMNLNHLEAIAHVQKLAFALTERDVEVAEVVVLPPFTDLRSVQTLIDGDRLPLGYGAQDLSPHPSGAYTGDVSGSMLAKLGCTYVIVGHSERREHHGESDELIGAKVRAAYAAGLVPILCIGEPLDVRERGRHVQHCTDQLSAALDGIPAKHAGGLVLAYEPVWAIGTGAVATPADAQEVSAALRTGLAERYSGDLADGVRILYGGSMKADNAAGILGQQDVDGGLVGGASLSVDDFVAIVRATPAAS
jgi:triosephosphate isomerase